MFEKINRMSQNLRIVFAIVLSLVTTIFAGNNFFLGNSPRINSFLFQLVPTSTQTPEVVDIVPTTQTQIIPTSQPTSKPKITQAILSPTKKPTPTSPKPLISPTPFSPPVPTKSPGITCPQSSSNTYASIETINDDDNRPAENHPDKNIHIRGYTTTTGEYNLIQLEGGVDEKGPRLSTIVGTDPPTITGLYRVNTWDWNTDQKGPPDTTWPVSILGVLAQPGQPVYVANSGYDVSLGNTALILYADESTITLKYTREDSVRWGYTVHIEDICVDPNLISAYQNLNSLGRHELPAVRNGDDVGVARTNEVKIAIRDTGEFLEPRSRKDWW